jgi:hypothetical protein
MMPQVPLGLLGLPIRNRLNDQPVLSQDFLSLAWCWEMKSTQAIDMSAAAAHESPHLIQLGDFV